MVNDLTKLGARVERLGYSSLTDLFLENPQWTIYTAANNLSSEQDKYAPVDIEIALRSECYRRHDFHFFARVTLFTALTNEGKGWSGQHYLLAGHWAGMMGKENEESVLRGWDYLKTLNVKDGWEPASIFDPVLEETLKHGLRSVR